MWLLVPTVIIAAAWLLAVKFDFVPPLSSKILIKIHNQQLRVTRGQLRAQPREFVSDILQQAGITHGYIAITYYNHAAFSRNIPTGIRQRLRNVILNTP